MAETRWTEDQKKVIDIRDKNVLVSAAAGSGKTAVLVERIISIVTGSDGREPIDIDRLLVVTFTRAAAGEMRERVLKALEQKAMEEPLNEHLRKQMTYIHNAKITTIDSFCNDVVREHFSELELDPAFKVADAGELALLRADVMAEILEENYRRGEEGFLKFIDIYSGTKSDSAIEDIVLRLHDFSMSYPNPGKWLKSLVDAYQDNAGDAWLELINADISNRLEEVINAMETALDLCDEYGFEKYGDVIEKERDMFSKILTKKDYDKTGELVCGFKFDRMPVMKGLSEEDELNKKQIQTIRDGYKKNVKSVGTKYFSRKYAEIIDDVHKCLPVVKTIVELVTEFGEAYKAAKADKNLVDFSDLEHNALSVLVREEADGTYVPTNTAREMAADYYEIMIDEYQDSNLVQEIILNAVSGRGEGSAHNMFMVGDVKQSIYKFRLARPELFLEKYNTYVNEDEDGDSRKIVLSKNFRSRHEVLEFCNIVFSQIMTKELGGISYDEENMLYAGAVYPESAGGSYKPEVLFIDTGCKKTEDDNEGESDEEALSNIEFEAVLTAGRIKELMYGMGGREPLMVYDRDSGQLRRLKFSDIAILFRSTAGYAEVYTEVLAEEGIPVYTSLSEGYFDTFEIGAILDMLSVIDNPRQDIKLAAVLRNVFGMTENMLADIRIGCDGTFYEAFMAYDGIYADMVHVIKRKIAEYRSMVSYLSIYDLICRITEDTHFREFIMSGKAGEKRLANVEMLLEKAKAYENGPYSGLFNFVRYIEKLKKYKVEQGEATVQGENDDSVKIMTIHKSKGLEYPVVFLGGTGKKMNMRDVSEKIVIHHELGIGINRVDTDRRIRYKTLIKEAVGNRIRLENIAEELRVLYVAMTRAREKLIITGIGNVTSKLDKLAGYTKHKPVEFGMAAIAGAVSYMDWFLMCLGRGMAENKVVFGRILPDELVYTRLTETKIKDDAKNALRSIDKSKVYDADMHKIIEETFSYEYEHAEECSIRSKMSISDIKHMYMKLSSDEEGAQEVDYGKENTEELITSDGAKRGTAYHRVFELFDYDRDIGSTDDVRDMMAEMVEKGLIDQADIELVNAEKIKVFSDSLLGSMMREAHRNRKLYREKPFVMGIPACDIEPDRYKSKELVVVQGIVDAWFYYDDGIVLVDYKTDSVKRIEDLEARYKSQLQYYGEALSSITGKEIKKRIIYSVKFGETLEV